MPKPNDITAYKGKSKAVLKSVSKPSGPKAAKGRGPSPKPPAQKRSEKVLLSLTPSERVELQEKAGLVPLATWIVHHLRTTGVLK